ncbi:MAG: hypothetical protein ACOX2K_06595 [Bacillota bacterium]|jgi:hypothetical protein
MKDLWITRIKVLVLSGLFASVGNYIVSVKKGAPIMPWEIFPALGMLFVIIVIGCMVDDFVKRHSSLKIPTIIYISLLSILVGVPSISPIADYFVTQVNKVNLLALCTPILAFAGISLGKDMDAFRKQGISIVVIALITFAGTYLGGTIVAQIILSLTGN